MGKLHGRIMQQRKKHPKGRRDYLKHKEHARVIVHQRISDINKQYGFSMGRISIRNQKTRWGSCSKKGNLNFNYRILFLPEETQRYIIAHELCHLKEFNHGNRFWSLVAQTSPNYAEVRSYLKKISIFEKEYHSW
jgi:predicted metal-dependent hydrolase